MSDPFDQAKYGRLRQSKVDPFDQVKYGRAPKTGVYVPVTPAESDADRRLRELLNAGPSGPSAADIAAANAAAAAAAEVARAKKAGKDQSTRENEATRGIVASLIASLKGFAAGRDTQLGNAETVFKGTLTGIGSQYDSAIGDAEDYKLRNEQDFDSKLTANITNRVRESMDLMAQVLSQGAGETDMFRALGQANRAYDANLQEGAASFNDTLRSIRSQANAAGSSAENARRNAFTSREEGKMSTMETFYKNMADTWTNIQRTEAGNSNIDSDYSVAYSPLYGGTKATSEIEKYVGKAYQVEAIDDEWASNWLGKSKGISSTARLGNAAAAVQAGPMKKAEGATLRKWING